MKDPFEAAVEEQESPPESPATDAAATEANEDFAASGEPDEETEETRSFPLVRPPSAAGSGRGGPAPAARGKDDEEEEDEEQMEVHLDKLPPGADPDKLEKMQAILSQFTQEQMNRYESFRRSGFQKSNIKRLLTSITGTQKISAPTNIVVSGIAKMFVGELIETARMVMTERNDIGPIRPCHIRESYRRLKLEGKIPRSSVPREIDLSQRDILNAYQVRSSALRGLKCFLLTIKLWPLKDPQNNSRALYLLHFGSHVICVVVGPKNKRVN
ncbi:hypothetical protein LUZ60_010489 [Juncus effusus]|nr:hypothetical protein LUZ60_010489 [Juncus effusus]